MRLLPKRLNHWSRRSLVFLGAGVVTVLVLLGTGAALFLGAANGPAANSSSVNLQKGLVGWYKLDGNAKDSSPYRHNGIINGSPVAAQDRKGRTNAAYSFNGTSDYVSMPASYLPTTAITISVWVNQSTLANWYDLVWDNWVTEGGWDLVTDASGTPLFGVYSGGVQHNAVCGAGTFTTNAWHHLVGTYDGSTVKLYMDGNSCTSTSVSGVTLSTANSMFFGEHGQGATHYLDDLRIYNRALSPAEVTALYNQYDPSLKAAAGDSGLVGQYKLDGNANDNSPYRHNTVVNGTTLASDREGKTNSAYSFNGTTDYIRSDGYPTLGTSNHPYSFTGWFNAQSVSSGSIIHMSAAGNGGGWCLPPVAVNAGHLVAYSWNSGLVTATGATSLSTGRWYHFAVTWDATNGLRVYLNGALDGSAAQAAYTASGASNYLYLGYENTSICNYRGPFTGSLDDIRVYSTSLSASAIAAQYNSYNSQVSDSTLQKGLVGDWEMNGNARDSSPYRYNGTVNGATLTTDRKARSNSAYSFNGSTTYIGMPTISIANSISVSAWVYSTNFNQNGFIADKNPVNSQWEIFFEGAVLRWRGGAAENTVFCSDPSNSNWHHIVGTQTGTTGTLYIDGQQCGTGTLTAIGNGSGVVEIGRFNNAYYFNGSIDSVKVWNRALGLAEVKALYNEYQ